MPAATPDFRLYPSNALDVLAGLLAEELRTPAPGAALLAPDTILIPQAAMRRWLQATLAAKHGIAANLEFLAPGQFVARVLDANVPLADDAASDDLDAEALQWRLYAALTDPAFRARPALRQIAAYLADGDPVKPWTLAGELAGVFGKYQAWRRGWLLRWEGGADPDDPQAELWRRVAAGRQHRARRIDTYLSRFEADGQPLPAGLPSRLFAFATLNVSPDVLRVIATQARAGTLHFYLPTPSQPYWGDLQTLPARLRGAGATPFEAEDNPLLQAWGAAGRDFMQVLGSEELVHPTAQVDAFADPNAPGASGAGAPDTLLRRLQSDLFHRRAAPPPSPTGLDPRTRLPALRLDDASLQVHACHTQLRELQVLHDRLRAWLDPASPEGAMFNPPLQPREIAVLAPDIDPYLPYVDAVFGTPGDAGRIPYAVADASPLAGEPLADMFVQLLALPLSRFGLNEILDLLASPRLAEAAGLDAPALARLHGWLQAAGARWGVDAAHRAAHDAPRDAAYTWQFALDRLLLGHASGDDADVAGVAPWPQLEGSALDALDALLRLLRVLARHATTLGEALTPGQWRERLLGLLKALLPQEPADAATQRALQRLRALIDDFAKHADTGGFDDAVPADVVRTHFAAALGEADTRAPLLTGGVSIGRMVPMRLLPFRAICVLGLNDGDYPRRDPAAGLNRLTAALGTDGRRPGDRSLRDDDRFLFLQLFAAAQDALHLSYLGADPRDGSVREPSVLVRELVEAAAEQHADPGDVRKRFVVRHPLQPFSAHAFGGDDPRRFSYRGEWQPAAAGAGTRRVALPPWFGDTLPASDASQEPLPLDHLRRFLTAPAEQFLRQRMGLRLAQVDAVEDDIEPLGAPGRGLARQQLQQAVFEGLLRGDDDATLQRTLRARGLLPSGALGFRTLEELRGEVAPYAHAFASWRGDATPDTIPFELDVDGVPLHGRIAGAYPRGIARIRFGEMGGTAAIRNGLDWLAASAAGLELSLVEFHDDNGNVGPHLRPALEADRARELLRQLLALRNRGLREPLPFAPYSGWDLFVADSLEKGLKAAAARWRGGYRGWAEGEGDALRVALRGRDPFTDDATQLAFVDLAMSIFSAVKSGTAYAGVDADMLAAIAGKLDLGDSDAEDAA